MFHAILKWVDKNGIFAKKYTAELSISLKF